MEHTCKWCGVEIKDKERLADAYRVCIDYHRHCLALMEEELEKRRAFPAKAISLPLFHGKVTIIDAARSIVQQAEAVFHGQVAYEQAISGFHAQAACIRDKERKWIRWGDKRDETDELVLALRLGCP